MKVKFNAMELKKTLRFIESEDITIYFNGEEQLCFIHNKYVTFKYICESDNDLSFGVTLKSSSIMDMIKEVRSKRTLLILECTPLNNKTVNVIGALNKDGDITEEIPMVGSLIAYSPKKSSDNKKMDTTSDLITFFDLSKNRNTSEYIPLTQDVYVWKVKDILTLNTVGIFERYSYCTHTDLSLKDGVYTFNNDALLALCKFHSEFLMKTSFQLSFRGHRIVFCYRNATIEIPLTKVEISMKMHPLTKKTVLEKGNILQSCDAIDKEDVATIAYIARKLNLIGSFKIYEMERCYVFQKSDGNTISEAIFMKQRKL